MAWISTTRPFLKIREVIEESRRLQKHQDDNFQRLNDFAFLITFTATHGTEVPIINPFGDRGAPCGFDVISNGVASVSMNTARLTQDNRLGMTVQFQPSAGIIDLQRSSAQSIANGTVVALQWTTDNAGATSSSGSTLFNGRFQYDVTNTAGTPATSSKIICLDDGYVDVLSSWIFAASSAGTTRAGWFSKNNSSAVRWGFSQISPSTVTQHAIPISARIPVVAGDYITTFIFQDSGGALNTSTETQRFQARYVSRTSNYSASITGILYGPTTNIMTVG